MKMTIRKGSRTRHPFLSPGAIRWGGSPVLALAGSLLVGLALLEIAAQRSGSVYHSVYVIFAQSVLYLISLACVRRYDVSPGASTRDLIFVLGVAAVLRGLAVAAPPFFSIDIYSYIWEGRVQAAGI